MTERLLHTAAATFEAARRVALLPEHHPARRLHGHGFIARVQAELPAGWGGFEGAETGALTQALRRCVAALDYRDLNEHLPVPTDENLARWVRGRLSEGEGVPGLAQVGIQSTREQGADLSVRSSNDETRSEPVHVWRRFRFEAAHRLPKVAPGHQCGRMHGHGFEVILHAEQDLADETAGTGRPAEMGVDYDQLAALWEPVGAELDHACLNDIPGLENPTSELLAGWLWQRLAPRLPALSRVSVYETSTAGCHFDGRRYRIWKELRFEGALRLTKAPSGDRRRRLHGHSYLLRLHLSAPLDEVLGWTLDYGDVKALFRPVYARLDHHELNALTHLADPNPARLALWIREAVAGALPQLDRIDLFETPGRGVVLCWGDWTQVEQGVTLPL